MSALRFVSVKTRVRPGYWSSTVRSMPGFWSSSTFMHCCSTLPLAAPTLPTVTFTGSCMKSAASRWSARGRDP
jgi:hypothetical protein